MYINCFKKRLFSEGKVYLLLTDCVGVLETDMDTLLPLCKEIKEIDNLGFFISEEEFNRILKSYFPNTPTVFQITSYDTLDIHIKDILSFYPLKKMLANDFFEWKSQEFGMTIDQYIEKIDFPAEVKKEKAKIQLKDSLEKSIKKYQKTVQEWLALTRNIPYIKFELILQHLITIKKERIFFDTFLTGDGIFWKIIPDMMESDVWEDAFIDGNTIMIPSVDFTDGYWKLQKEDNRDFRKYSVFDNIVYCIQNLPAKDEWSDEIVFKKGGVNIGVDKIFLMKVINPDSFSDVYFVDGFPILNAADISS